MCFAFKKMLLEDYEQHGDILRCLKMYIGFLMEYAFVTPKDDSYRRFTDWQIADMCMSTYNPKIDTSEEPLETLWRWSRRLGKTQKETVLAVLGALMDYKVVWRATYTDQLQQAGAWFNMNPFVRENKISSKNIVGVYGSPDINIAVLSEAKVASRGADWLFYDEGGWCFTDHKKYEYYEASRAMIMDSQDKRITHVSTPAKKTSFRNAWEFLKKQEHKLNTTLTSHHPWSDSTWITQKAIDRERELHSDCPWYIQQNYDAEWVVPGGAVFTNIIEEGDPNGPRKPDGTLKFYNGFLEAFKNKWGVQHWGVDFNGQNTQHYRIGINYDADYVYVLEETKFLDLWELDGLSGTTEVEDGLFNNVFTDQLKRMGVQPPVRYAAWGGKQGKYDSAKQANYDTRKQARVQELQNRKIVINKHDCPTTLKNLHEAGFDKNSRLPKLAKQQDQHGLDALLHAMHKSSGGGIYISQRGRYKNVNPFFSGGVKRQELKI